MKLTPKAEGIAPFSDTASWVVVASRQADGSWKWDWVVPNSSQPMPGAAATGEDEQALFQLEQQWNAAGPARDTAVVEKFLANEFVSNVEGRHQNKTQYLAEMKANPAKIESGGPSGTAHFSCWLARGRRATGRPGSCQAGSTRGTDRSGLDR